MIRSVLITGGGSGIGAALATNLAERGCMVAVTGRREASLKAVADQSDFISACVGDVTVPEDQDAMVDLLSELPAPRAIFHGAGYFQLGQLVDLSSDEWKQSFDTNVTARWALSAKSVETLEGGRILFIGSDSGSNPRVGGAAYSVAQSASETLRRALQAEWSDRNVAIAGFKPGLVDTDLVRGFMSKPEREFPARNAFQSYIDRGEYSLPATIGKFASWLMMDVETERFCSNEWDIRNSDHHPEWLEGGLYI